MRKAFFMVMIALFTGVACVSCSHQQVKVSPNGKMPPGQAKKVTGEKSAKKYAPGQQKKNP